MQAIRKAKAFTLIELLIVVAIIAVLALIAVPNFLEAQVRAKVGRAWTDIRSQRTALEAYRLDNDAYPRSANVPLQPRLSELSTPISYITSCPKDPFFSGLKQGVPWAPGPYYHYVSATDEMDWLPRDWRSYMYGAEFMDDSTKRFPVVIQWHIRSMGPNGGFDYGVRYDPTNGTVSVGDICVFGP